MVNLLLAALFGVLEGLTEWLPVSSTGHLILLRRFVAFPVRDEFFALFEVVIQLAAIGAYQACPKAGDITEDDIAAYKQAGLVCRAWGISDTDIMKRAVEMGVDGGMTVNFPDKLIEYMKNR